MLLLFKPMQKPSEGGVVSLRKCWKCWTVGLLCNFPYEIRHELVDLFWSWNQCYCSLFDVLFCLFISGLGLKSVIEFSLWENERRYMWLFKFIILLLMSELDNYNIPSNIELINTISKQFKTIKDSFDGLPTWIVQSQDLMLRSTVFFPIVTYSGFFFVF